MQTVFTLDPAPDNQKPILLIHGLGSDSTSWQLQIPELIKLGYRPIAIDVPGFGKSHYCYKRWTIYSATRIIIRELIDLLPGEVSLLGLSLGGVIAQQIIKERPERIEKAILASTFSHLHPDIHSNFPYLSRRLLQVFTGNINSQAQNVADRIFPLESQKVWHNYLYQQILTADPKIYRQAMVSLARFNSQRWMKETVVPCLVVTGSRDTTVTMENQKRLADLIPSGEWRVIKDGGHAVNVDHIDEFNQIMDDYFQS